MRIFKGQWTVVSDQWSENKEKLTTHHSSLNTGFTLMELMVVIAIIVLLAGIMVPNLANRLERAKITKTEADIASIESAIAMYETDTGRYPTAGLQYLKDWLTGIDTGTGVDVSVPEAKDWHGPYIKGIEQDPWKEDYVYLKNEHPRDVGLQIPGTDYPDDGRGGCVEPPHNLGYYIYSLGKNRSTGTIVAHWDGMVDGDSDNEDDINNWDVNKMWREAY